MEFLDGLYNNFMLFFSWEEFSFLFTGEGILVTLSLVLSEGLLSFDNALVLAIMVSHLPKDKHYRLGPLNMSIQQWALTAGLFGAYFFRIIAIGLGTYLIRFWTLQLIGGGYLLWLAYEHFFICKNDACEIKTVARGFWATVLKVELMDIAFSIDSILAALGISKKIWVILLGGMLGILFMRFVAGIFVRLIDRFPLFEHTGYALITLIGYRLISEVDWIHFSRLFEYLGPEGILVIGIFVLVVRGTAQVKKDHVSALNSLINLSAFIIFASYISTKFELHMNDLIFSLIMLATFISTFIFNRFYVQWFGVAAKSSSAKEKLDIE